MMGRRRGSVSSREEGDSERGQVGKDVRRKKHTFPFTNGLKHTSNTTISFDCSGIPFPGDNIGTSLGFSEAVPSEREVNHCNQKHSRIAGRRGKPMSTVSRRKDDHAVPVRVTQHYFTSLDQNLKTSFLSTSSHNKVPFSISFEIAECSEIPLSENVDSTLDMKKSAKIRRSRKSRKRRKGSHCEQYMTYSSLHPQSYFCSNQSSTMRRPKILKALEDDVPMPAANKLVPSTEKEKCCLTNDVFDDSKNVCILPEVNLDSPNSSDIKTHQKEFNIERKKIKCLKNEVHENHNLDSASLHDSIIHRGKDATCAFALNNLSFLHNEMDCSLVDVEKALRSPFRKKLLVLDLNGILCDVIFGSHGSCLAYKKVGMRSVFKRPFLDDFLAFCFQRFAVGIWSSRNKNNIVRAINYVMGDSKDRLLFCWDQSKCTYTGYNTIENKHKPLVLKELIKLWDKDEASLPWEKGEYSPSNTLLVDDSPYKALSNPPHSAIFPSPYDFRDKGDSVLGPDGALRVYLESIAMAEDVQEHVKKHSFGQQAITPQHSMWSFYKNIIDKSKESSQDSTTSNEAEVSLLKLEVEKKLVFRF